MDHDEHVARLAIDAIAGAAVIAGLMKWLPPIAAILGIVWYVLQIYSWFERRCNKRKRYKRRATDHG